MTRINLCPLLNHPLDAVVRPEIVVLEPEYIEEILWRRQHNDHWLKLGKGPMKVNLRPPYTQAHEIAERLTGKKLDFNP